MTQYSRTNGKRHSWYIVRYKLVLVLLRVNIRKPGEYCGQTYHVWSKTMGLKEISREVRAG